MKRSFLCSAGLALIAFVMPYTAIGQNVFNPPLIMEANDTSGQCHDVLQAGLPAHANAYSHGEMLVNGVPCDLYVYTWDPAPSFCYPDYGFAVRQYSIGTPVNNSTTPMYEDYRAFSTLWPQSLNASPASMDAVILQYNGEPYILVCYYDCYMTHQFFIELFKWTGAGGLQPQGPPQVISVSSDSPFDWINLDAYNLNDFILTWSENEKIYTKAGVIASGSVNMGNTVTLDNSSYIDDGSQPDVALVSVGGSSPNAHFVYTNDNKNKLLVATLPFDDIYTAPPNAVLTPTFEDFRTTPGKFNVPRIDAPDDYPDDDWSYVVADQQNGQDNIFTGLHHAGSTMHFNVNDGSFLPAPPIAGVPDHINDIPVVAYDHDGDNLYYCWYYYSSVQPPSAFDKAYIGLKITNAGIQTGLNNKYWRVQDSTQNTSGQPAIALSTQNNASPELFMAFLQTHAYLPTLGYTGIKTVPWNHFPFRPDPSLGIASLGSRKALYPAPNPFGESFQIVSKRAGLNNCSLTLRDITGRSVLQLQGNLKQINQELLAKTPLLLPGVYLGQVTNKDRVSMAFKVVKIK